MKNEQKKFKIATVFSGIGAFEQALKKLSVPYEIIFACDNGEREIKETEEEILEHAKVNKFNHIELNNYVRELYDNTKKENWMEKSYLANYAEEGISKENFFEDIRFIDGKQYKDKVDILVGGSPCQSFSNMGKRKGLEDARGTLFYYYAKLVKDMQPKVFIYENVPGMLNHDGGKTWETIKEVFKSLKYNITEPQILNAKDYGIPQNRRRLFVIGFRDDKDTKFKYPEKLDLNTVMFDYLEPEKDIPLERYLQQKGFEFVTTHPGRASINQDIIRTEKAQQQFNWNGDFVFVPLRKIKKRKEIFKDRKAYVGKYEGQEGVIRQLTPRECLRLMGFSDTFKIVCPDMHMYRQAGNSIVVNVLENILKEIFKVEKFGLKLKEEDFEKPIRIATVFSGIGAVEFALKRMNRKHQIVFACDNGEREIEYDIEKERKHVKSLNSIKAKKDYVDDLYFSQTGKENYVKESYLANYPQLKENRFFEDVILLDGTDFKGKVDLFVGGSPCQSFSSVGFQGGLEDARGTLFYEYARLVKEIEPKVFIYENVRNLLNHDKGKTWEKIKEIFDSLGYKYKFEVLDAKDYGIPQTRRRLFVVGFKDEEYFNKFNMPKPVDLKYIMKDFTENNCGEGKFTFDKKGELKLGKGGNAPDEKYTLSELLYKYVMNSGTKTFYQKPEINKDVARTLLKTMGNRHRAGIDNYVSFDGTDKLGSVRMLTERECHRLMGFTDDYKIVVSRAQAYKQAGNSIVVDVMMNVLKEIIKTNVFDNDDALSTIIIDSKEESTWQQVSLI